MSFIVIDTDVASLILKRRLPDALAGRLAGASIAITFVTLGELTRWTIARDWGPNRLAALEHFIARLVVLPYSPAVARTWGSLQARAQRVGRPRPANDTWIAACCLVREHPLATVNVKDFAHFAEHEGLQLVR